MENQKIIEKAGWVSVYALTTAGSIKSNTIGLQIALGFLSAYSFNKILA